MGCGRTVGSTGSSTNPYLFAATSGYRTDGDAGLMHVGVRYYDPQVGRFITRDTVLTEHPYLYCDHDPVNAVDPSGHIIAAVLVYGTAAYITIRGLVNLVSDIEEVRIINQGYKDMVDMIKRWQPKTEAGEYYKDRLLLGDLRNGNIGAITEPIMGAIGAGAVITIGLATPSILRNVLKIIE